MEENVPTAPPAQPIGPAPARDFKPILLSGLVVLIILLLGGVLFFDQIKSLFHAPQTSLGSPESRQGGTKATPTAYPTIDPRVVCARFTNLSFALTDIDKACILDLSSQNLSSVPEDILKLKKLNAISLNKNKLNNFPVILTQIQTLIEIDLADNNISRIPGAISNLTNLQKIDLSNNNISELPETTGSLTKINYLILLGNNFSSAEQEKIRKMFPEAKITF